MNTEQLQQALDATYDTFTGPPRAYFELETDAAHGRMRFVYTVYKLVIEARKDDTTDYEAKLCDELHRRFMAPLSQADKEDRIATLVWRREVRYSRDLIMTGFDEDETPHETGRVRHQVSVRCYCPRVPAFAADIEHSGELLESVP